MNGTPLYSFDLAQFGGKVAIGVFENAIRASSIETEIHEVVHGAGMVDVQFVDVLSAEDEAMLYNLVAAHDGEFIPKEIVAKPTWEFTDGLNPKWESYLYTATAGAVNIFDEVITTEIVLRGGAYQIFNAEAVYGDYIEFAMVDKDDVLGLFSTYGLVQGQPGHILELTKYVKKDYIVPGSVGFARSFEVNGGRNVMAGIYLRTIYNSTGTQDVQFASRVKNYE